MSAQPGVLSPPPNEARSLTFHLRPGGDPKAALRRLADGFALELGVVGLGQPLVAALGRQVPGLRSFPSLPHTPATQQALWVLLQGGTASSRFDQTAALDRLLSPELVLGDALDLFVYAGGRDLTGYEDGTENPKDEKAAAAALRPDGSSFVAVQRWTHDLKTFGAFDRKRQDEIIGRRRETNDELADAPPTSHVRRAAQESFEPEAFMVRRSMPWACNLEQGLEFIAYGESLDRFERVLRRMVGLEDGQLDALFSFSKPVAGAYHWCPPAAGARLDLSALGL